MRGQAHFPICGDRSRQRTGLEHLVNPTPHNIVQLGKLRIGRAIILNVTAENHKARGGA